MSALVESMAYTNEVPWHGLGEYVGDQVRVKEMMRAANIDWKVEKKPMILEGTKRPVPGFYALTRDKDGKVLDVVGSKYVPTQNHEAFEFFTDFVEAGDATMETAGSLREGRYVWGLANLNKSFTLPGKDKVKGYLLVACPHEHGKSIIIRVTSVRVVCNNTLTMALGKGQREKDNASFGMGEFRMGHRRSFDGTMIKRAKETLGIARDQMEEFREAAEMLRKKPMDEQDAITFYADLLKVDEAGESADEVTRPRIKHLLDINQRAPGAQPDNAWGVLNSITYYADHVASRTDDKRLTNAWFGKTARMKEQALSMLLAA